jgi:hypothetical protein
VSINAIRTLVLIANVLLIGLIGWAGYDTWYGSALDRARWEVTEPKYEKFVPPELADDQRQRDQQLYKVISKVFDPPKPEAEKAPPPPPPPTADVHQIEVRLLQYNKDNPSASSACLHAPLSKDPANGQPVDRYFMPGMDLGQPGLGFEA